MLQTTTTKILKKVFPLKNKVLSVADRPNVAGSFSDNHRDHPHPPSQPLSPLARARERERADAVTI